MRRLPTAYAMQRAKDEIIERLREALPASFSVSADDLKEPPERDMGDVAFPCFALAKEMRKSPAVIAQETAAAFVRTGLVASASAAGPYVNFRLDRNAFSDTVLSDLDEAGEDYGAFPTAGERMIIEYGQPNTHKEVHVGHLRNFFLGLSVVRLERAAGNRVITASYIGDVGAHVAKCLWAYGKFHAGERPEKGSEGKFLGAIYTEATRRVEEDETLKEEVSAVQRALEAGDPKWTALWKETRQWSLDEMADIFRELGCEFDRVYTESEVEARGKALVRELLERGIAKESQGAIVVDLESEGLGVFLVLKSDGSALYATKELALVEKKFQEYEGIDTSIHIVDTRQSLYFKQFFSTLKLMGLNKRMVHLAYDFVTLKEGAMSSRKGNVVTYAEFRDEMIAAASAETSKRHEDWDAKKVTAVASDIAQGAMKFAMLKQDNDKPIVFDAASALAFEGFTGPYVQYAHARMCSILEKAGEPPFASGYGGAQRESGEAGPAPHPIGASGTGGQVDGFTEKEFAVLRRVAELPDVVRGAAGEFRPSLLAQYAFDLAQEVNDFYRDVPVLSAVDADRERRVRIVGAVRKAIERALFLLGIPAPEEM